MTEILFHVKSMMDQDRLKSFRIQSIGKKWRVMMFFDGVLHGIPFRQEGQTKPQLYSRIEKALDAISEVKADIGSGVWAVPIILEP